MAQKLGEIFQVAQLGGKGRALAPPPPAAPAASSRPRSATSTSEMMVSKIIPDERSNQLIVIANERAYARLLTLVHKLDVPLEGGDGRIHVYYCENANCDELAQTLGAVTGVVGVGRGGRPDARRAAGRRRRRRRRRRAAARRARARRCCSRATCASTSIARPTR